MSQMKRQSYTASEKLKMIAFAEKNGNRAAEREFGISECNMRRWRKNKENLKEMPRMKRAAREKVWRSRRGGLGRQRSMLVYDVFEAHVTDSVKAAFRRENTDLAVIPGGLTSLLQPLDVCLNKPFKDRVKEIWMKWMAEGVHQFTAGGRQKKPSEELICSWIAQAWQSIPEEMIVRSFLKCGISNNLDGTEDETTYEESDDESAEGLDDSFVRALFESDSESEFEGFEMYF